MKERSLISTLLYCFVDSVNNILMVFGRFVFRRCVSSKIAHIKDLKKKKLLIIDNGKKERERERQSVTIWSRFIIWQWWILWTILHTKFFENALPDFTTFTSVQIDSWSTTYCVIVSHINLCSLSLSLSHTHTHTYSRILREVSVYVIQLS
jgi:hypothetical protein